MPPRLWWLFLRGVFMEENKVMTDEMEIGAKIIGKAVVEATKICNQITDK